MLWSAASHNYCLRLLTHRVINQCGDLNDAYDFLLAGLAASAPAFAASTITVSWEEFRALFQAELAMPKAVGHQHAAVRHLRLELHQETDALTRKLSLFGHHQGARLCQCNWLATD